MPKNREPIDEMIDAHVVVALESGYDGRQSHLRDRRRGCVGGRLFQAACNQRHSLDQLLCRSLLVYLDRLPSNQLNMTQELLSNMLGVRREGVNSAAAKLQCPGAIRYTRGQITVVDRSKLEGECCECYTAVKEETDRLVLQARVERQLCAGQY
jgi:hypothetical protein